MAACFFLLKQFDDVLLYLNSIKSYFYNDDTFNFNYGQAKAAVGQFRRLAAHIATKYGGRSGLFWTNSAWHTFLKEGLLSSRTFKALSKKARSPIPIPHFKIFLWMAINFWLTFGRELCWGWRNSLTNSEWKNPEWLRLHILACKVRHRGNLDPLIYDLPHEVTNVTFSCRGRCCIMNGKARIAWELYLKMETSGESFSLLQLIANDCYKVLTAARIFLISFRKIRIAIHNMYWFTDGSVLLRCQSFRHAWASWPQPRVLGRKEGCSLWTFPTCHCRQRGEAGKRNCPWVMGTLGRILLA